MIGQWAIYLIVVAAIIAIVYVILKQMGITVPKWVEQILWILLLVVIGIGAIKFLLTLL